MTDILRRTLAPLSDEAWQAIDEEATRTLKAYLSGRVVVDFKGPFGWEYGAVDLGRLDLPKRSETTDVSWGLRQVLPLVEVRTPFFLDQMELDGITRGSANPDLTPLADAARKTALFEERAIYSGFPEGGIEGILRATTHGPFTLPKEPRDYPESLTAGVKALQLAGIQGPYALVLGPGLYQDIIQSSQPGYPLRKLLEELIGGGIHMSLALEGGLVLSMRGGDFELTVGQDLSIGYAAHDRNKMELYITESFTFRVLEPAAAIQYKAPV